MTKLTHEQKLDIIGQINAGIADAQSSGVDCGYPNTVDIDRETVVNDKALESKTDWGLLYLSKLLKTEEGDISIAPKTIQLHGKWLVACVAIGNDEVAQILIEESALKAIEELTKIKFNIDYSSLNSKDCEEEL